MSGLCIAGTTSANSISSVGSVRTASTRSTEILSICSVCLEYEVYFHRLGTVPTIICLTVGHETLTDVVPRVGVGANYFRWGQLGYSNHWSVFREYVLLRVLSVFRVSVLRILLALQVSCVSKLRIYLPVLSRFHTAHTLSTLLISVFSSLAICGPSQCLPCFGRQCSNPLSTLPF